ncbi:2-amino-4-hydroxy-6-hydroxymethyldihydropteridine diphosphokinase [Halioxenophilus aromaticivorans]|uniref:2-amino-4-hydroxy-6-hydroxymethyldihydropteridine pyrophosphokinase n=1 Tax=Halioxenophilus aromaticivorans TaxID=1306992 RepID=A0AAV3U8A6_9ALTE
MAQSVTAYIALGSNLDNPLTHVTQACAEINALPNTQVVDSSPWYISQAVGPGQQPDFINGALQLTTQLPAQTLLESLQTIENQHGRQREVRWGARTLDLDILLYGDDRIQTDTLTVPHPYLHKRNFVVYPLANVAPNLVLPNGTALAEVQAQLGDQGLQCIGRVYSQ